MLMTYPIIQVPDGAGETIEQLGTKLKFRGDTLMKTCSQDVFEPLG